MQPIDNLRKDGFGRAQRKFLDHQRIYERNIDQILERNGIGEELENKLFKTETKRDTMKEK